MQSIADTQIIIEKFIHAYSLKDISSFQEQIENIEKTYKFSKNEELLFLCESLNESLKNKTNFDKCEMMILKLLRLLYTLETQKTLQKAKTQTDFCI